MNTNITSIYKYKDNFKYKYKHNFQYREAIVRHNDDRRTTFHKCFNTNTDIRRNTKTNTNTNIIWNVVLFPVLMLFLVVHVCIVLCAACQAHLF